jgi:MFS family permease
MDAYETNLPRAALGIAMGTIAGAGLVTLFAVLTDIEYFREYGRQTDAGLLVFIYAAFAWGAGLMLFAPVPWAILHHYGARTWPVAMALGAFLTFAVVVGLITNGFGLIVASPGFSAADNGGPTWIDGRLTRHGWAEAVKVALACSVAGAVVGLLVWRTAYRRTVPRITPLV